MCIKPVYTYIDHLEVFSWNRTGIANAPEGFLCHFNEGPSPVVYMSILELLLVVLNSFIHENDRLGTQHLYIYECPGVPLKFSRLAGVTGQCACQDIGRNCQHCQFKSDNSPGRIYDSIYEFSQLNSLEEAPSLKKVRIHLYLLFGGITVVFLAYLRGEH